MRTSFFDGIDVSLNGIATLAHGRHAISEGRPGGDRASWPADAMKQYSRRSSVRDRADSGGRAEGDTRADGPSAVELACRARQERRAVRTGREGTAVREALAASLEISFQTTVATPEGWRRGGRGRGRRSRTQAAAANASAAAAPPAADGRSRRTRRGPTFTIAIPGQSFAVEAQLFNESPESADCRDCRA